MFSDYLAVLCQGNMQHHLYKKRKAQQQRANVYHTFSQGVHWLKCLSAGEEVHLGMLVAAYDRLTNEHARRTMGLAGVVARQMKCTGEEIVLSCLAALLHDIGKAVIPSVILAKPGPLNEEEWQIMRLHPGIGGQMLQQAGGIFEKVEHIVVAHHERWDGMGYPFGLAGEEIPLLARILAVVDSFDAMTMSRVYQRGRSFEEARRELLQGAGSQYDPGVVEVFVSLLYEEQEHTSSFFI